MALPSRTFRALCRTLALVGAVAGAHEVAAQPAEESRVQPVPVQVDVVVASMQAGQVETSLRRMHEALAAKRRYGTLRRESTQTLSVGSKAVPVPLPRGGSATLRLESVRDGVATVRVSVAAAQSTVSLARERALYFQAGSEAGVDVWLVLARPGAESATGR